MSVSVCSGTFVAKNSNDELCEYFVCCESECERAGSEHYHARRICVSDVQSQACQLSVAPPKVSKQKKKKYHAIPLYERRQREYAIRRRLAQMQIK